MDFSESVGFGIFLLGFRVWEGLQSIGNGWGLRMDEFSVHFEPSGSSFDDSHDFDDFAIVSSPLTLFPEGPRTLRKCSKGPGTLSEGPGILREGVMMVCCSFRKVPGPSETVSQVPGPSGSVLPDWSQLVWSCLDKSELVGTYRNLSELLWP